jgi:acetylornithine deacetylase
MGAATSTDPVRQLLDRLVAFPTESLTPNRGLIDWVADYLHAFGACTSVIEGPEGRANLLATIGPDRPGGLLLSGHTDVVPAGTGWTGSPFRVMERGSDLVGRGTADMKGFIACLLVAVTDVGVASLRRPLHIALSFDEEVGCVGVRSLIDHVASCSSVVGAKVAVAPDLILIGEPTMMRPRHAHPGKVAYRLTFNAVAGHSSLSPFLPTAIGSAAKVVAALDAIAEPYRKPRGPEEHGDASADVTVNIGTIHGGSGLNVLSELCELTFELRHAAAGDPDLLLTPLWEAVEMQRRVLAQAAGSRRLPPVEVTELTRYPALATDAFDPWVSVVERIADRGKSVPIGFGTEGGLFAAAMNAPVIVCGPGDITVAHKPDEYVSVEQLRACLRFLGRLIERVCGGDEPA